MGLLRLLIFRRAWFYRLAIHNGHTELMRHSDPLRVWLMAGGRLLTWPGEFRQMPGFRSSTKCDQMITISL
jgi:hypothetical protein